MARIEGLRDEDAGFLKRFVFRTAKAQLGDVPAPLRVMARNGAVMWGAALFQLGFDRAKRVDSRLKTLVSLKAASMVGCLF